MTADEKQRAAYEHLSALRRELYFLEGQNALNLSPEGKARIAEIERELEVSESSKGRIFKEKSKSLSRGQFGKIRGKKAKPKDIM
jgi:hypothetical protein